jgi:phosphoribosylanthranilate isomerase
MPKVKVKICGITNWADAQQAIAGGASFLGFNFYAGSPRYIKPLKARKIVERLPKDISTVGVFVNESEDKTLGIARAVGLHYLQLHGDESAATVTHLERSLPVIKAIRVQAPFRVSQLARFKNASALLLDGFDAAQWGGSGRTFDWKIAKRAAARRRIFLAGGLTAGNVAQAIRAAKPYAVDVCSGVEAKPGKKDPARMKAFLHAARDAQRKAASARPERKLENKKR